MGQQVVLARLRTRHNRLNSDVHSKLKLASSPTCPCGQEDQTTEHVLQTCPLHKATREDEWPVSTFPTTKLFGSKQELEKTTSFISRAALIVQSANAKKKQKKKMMMMKKKKKKKKKKMMMMMMMMMMIIIMMMR